METIPAHVKQGRKSINLAHLRKTAALLNLANLVIIVVAVRGTKTLSEIRTQLETLSKGLLHLTPIVTELKTAYDYVKEDQRGEVSAANVKKTCDDAILNGGHVC